MTATLRLDGERRQWLGAGAVALVAHAAALALVLAWARPAMLPEPEPVITIDLPPMAAPAIQPLAAPSEAQPVTTPIDSAAPTMTAPPSPAAEPQAVLPPPALTPPPPLPTAASTPPPVAAAPAQPRQAVAVAPVATPGSDDPRAKQRELDYFALVSAHLNRRKTYPVEAKKAREQGVVTVRFTVDRAGNVSAVALKRSSGHPTLDEATLTLVQRVAPLPRMPASMPRDSVTLALPIDYSLRTD